MKTPRPDFGSSLTTGSPIPFSYRTRDEMNPFTKRSRPRTTILCHCRVESRRKILHNPVDNLRSILKPRTQRFSTIVCIRRITPSNTMLPLLTYGLSFTLNSIGSVLWWNKMGIGHRISLTIPCPTWLDPIFCPKTSIDYYIESSIQIEVYDSGKVICSLMEDGDIIKIISL